MRIYSKQAFPSCCALAIELLVFAIGASCSKDRSIIGMDGISSIQRANVGQYEVSEAGIAPSKN